MSPTRAPIHRSSNSFLEVWRTPELQAYTTGRLYAGPYDHLKPSLSQLPLLECGANSGSSLRMAQENVRVG